MVHELDDMGTPSAPPITDVGIEEKSFEVESQIEQTGNGVYKSRESESFDGNKEVLEDWKSQFEKEGELDER